MEELPFSERAQSHATLSRFGIEPRGFNRVRWLRKAKVLADYAADRRADLAYLLASPEVDDFTYDLGTELELLSWLSETFHEDRVQVAEFVEGRSNERMWERVTDAAKRKLSITTAPLGGLLWYVIARLLRLHRIVEGGIHDGIGSLVLLAALQKNATDGHDGSWRGLTLITVPAGSRDHILDASHERRLEGRSCCGVSGQWQRTFTQPAHGQSRAFELTAAASFLHKRIGCVTKAMQATRSPTYAENEARYAFLRTRDIATVIQVRRREEGMDAGARLTQATGNSRAQVVYL